MHLNLLTAFTTLLTLATATPFSIRPFYPTNSTITGHAIITNNCDKPLYIWSVGSTISPQTTITPGQNYTELFHTDKKTGGVALKITTKKDGLYTSAPQTVFAYNLVDESVWFDLSDVFGDPFKGEMVSLMPSEPAIVWTGGVPPEGSQVRRQGRKEDLVLSLC